LKRPTVNCFPVLFVQTTAYSVDMKNRAWPEQYEVTPIDVHVRRTCATV